jgi:hypothetical protein
VLATWLVNGTLDVQAAAAPPDAGVAASAAPVSTATIAAARRKWFMAGPSLLDAMKRYAATI